MFVTKKKYNNAVEYWKGQYVESSTNRMTRHVQEMSLTAAESALRYREDAIEELQAEVYEITKRGYDLDKEIDDLKIRLHVALTSGDIAHQRECDTIHKYQKQVEEAQAAQHRAEAALSAATKISYVVALHERDVPALERYTSLDTAYGEYNESFGEFPNTHPYRIFQLRGDTIIADVTDPRKWDETLTTSEARETLEQGSRVSQGINDYITYSLLGNLNRKG